MRRGRRRGKGGKPRQGGESVSELPAGSQQNTGLRCHAGPLDRPRSSLRTTVRKEKGGELTAVSAPSPCPHRRESVQSEDKEVERCESVQVADPAPAQSAPLTLPRLVVNLALGCMSYFVVLFC